MEQQSRTQETQMVDPLFIHITKRLRQIAHEINKYSKHLQESHKITLPQIICLREIYEHGPISFSALTKLVALNNSTVTGIIDRLEKQNLVRRTRTSADRRQIHIEITEPGVRFLEEAPSPLKPEFIRGLNRLSEDEVDSILKALDSLTTLLQPDGEITEPAPKDLEV